jgi:hypothetical protein
VLEPELWTPTTESWTTLAPMRTPRMYHSTTLLLPDARVLVAGGGHDAPEVDQRSAEIYSPPYLFKGPRPAISSVPSVVGYGAPFVVGTPDGARIASVTLMGLGAVTHAFDSNQRRVPLSFQTTDGGLTIQAPANARLAPPGSYMLFLVDSNGVPSVAPMIKLASLPPQRFPLTVDESSPLGVGKGAVSSTSSPDSATQIDCGAVCSVSFDSGTVVTLTARADFGSSFSGWGGCDTTSGATCTVTVNAARSVTARFLP